jgi:CDP-diacylglycerol--glycerol-3-phosphate 3-phosphatidyltransferase
MKYRDFLQKIIYQMINPLIKGMIRIGITPNIITTTGLIGNMNAAGFFIYAALHNCDMPSVFWGGIIILLAGLFDMMDGRLARMGHMTSSFGALLDSTLDRYSEMVTLMGIVLIFTEHSESRWFFMGIITFAALLGSMMVSYIRARAEGLQIECKVGLMQRPERVVVTAITAILTGATENLWWLAGGMIIIAVLANLTAFWRMAHCYKVLKNKNK